MIIKILDENDNPPKFSQEIYTAVIPENVPTDFSIVTVKAYDADSGKNGEVQYIIQDDTDSQPISKQMLICIYFLFSFPVLDYSHCIIVLHSCTN